MDLKYKLAIGAGVVSSTYGLQELFPDINVFRTMNDMSAGYAKMMVIIGVAGKVTNKITVLTEMEQKRIISTASTASSKGSNFMTNFYDKMTPVVRKDFAGLGDGMRQEVAKASMSAMADGAAISKLVSNANELGETAIKTLGRSDSGKFAIKAGWGVAESRGLEKTITIRSDTSVKLFLTYEDDVLRKTFGAVDNGIINVNNLDPSQLAKYIKYWNGNPLDDSAGIFKLVKMYRSDGTKTLVGSSGEFVDDAVVLRKGQHLGPDNGFGWDHIKAEGHNNQIMDSLGLLDNEQSVKDVIGEVLRSPDLVKSFPGEKYEFYKTITRSNNKHNIIVVVSDRADAIGSINSAYPVSGG